MQNMDQTYDLKIGINNGPIENKECKVKQPYQDRVNLA